jgi:hypothetical protein
MPQRAIRFSDEVHHQINKEARTRGFSSPTAFIRSTIEQELSGRRDGAAGVEERLSADLEQLRRDVARLARAHQALFSYLDTLAKTILTCLPEPPADVRSLAVSRARERYEHMLKAVGRAMVGDAREALQDLVSHVE